MSLSGVVSFALLFKKIVRKGSIAKRFKSKKETHGQTQTQNSEEDPPFDSFNLCREKKPNQGKSTHVLYGQQEKPILPQTSSDTLVPRLSLYTKNRLSELPSLSPADQNDISPFRCASDNNANVNVNVNANVNMVNTPTNLDKDSNEDPAGQVSQSLSPVARDKIPELVINELDNSSNQVYNPLSDTIVAETPGKRAI
ncbi:hypothetical protein PHYBLDRAFT_60870 [Phycomyces blakesleeanus NRRL 1555(-)]|uniref:Uncharacterized protein n=1 Tax=Phycomyces blakesleeanus (strain ATCC 8743b / DSM 1359 / FGSC 10004 / NBRC 33097 / NRRL 1555) TaxID=763407 RepID=A0A167PED3_PHYB8|nr:hypothetical protein PHYBLDRAFT_60870 [Phycomyces blakesleeanus NRRL 1555(-)]OAD77749.1 hypothetical protein PHYBLDRAFT_60870 [Phycomyces blakesleeanus NRRL 1555(-)]|eukprot:XP_018295789.1 hypothetical protein PHYBLDRAFT_60870 [Phycomyces blakesleeanus NRRL 1555(-)]